MAFFLGYNLTDLSISLIKILYYYRGAKGNQLAALHYSINYTESQEKTIYKYLKILHGQKLVTNVRLQQGSFGSMYFLTEKGFELAKSLFNIDESQRGNGWVDLNLCIDVLGDFSYETYKPPLSQTVHHLLLIDFFIQLKSLNSDYIRYRNNLYCSVTFEKDEDKFRFRPDGEVCLEDGSIYSIEIDLGTESHEQLQRKFQTYFHYFNHLKENGINLKHVGIIIVVENKTKLHGIKRRWKNIAAAFFQEMQRYHQEINVILTTIDKVKETILFEIYRKKYKDIVINNVNSFCRTNDYDEKDHHGITDKNKELIGTVIKAIEVDQLDITMNLFSQEYETSVYSSFFEVNKHIEAIKRESLSKGLYFRNLLKNIFFVNERPYIIRDFSPYKLNDQLESVFNNFASNVEFIEIEKIEE